MLRLEMPCWNTAFHVDYFSLDNKSKRLGIEQFLNIVPTAASIYRLVLSVARCAFTGDQYNMATKCILSIYSQPFKMLFAFLLEFFFTLKSSQSGNKLLLFNTVKRNDVYYAVTCICIHTLTIAHYPHLLSLPPHTHISTMQWSLADCDLTNSWPTPLKWQNVTFMKTWPISSGTVVVDGKFTVNKSLKTQPKGHRFVEGDTCSAHGFARSLLDNLSSVYSPVITSGDPPPWVSHLFLVSLLLVCFQLCS